MVLTLHRPYPGVALLAVERGSVLFGAPADAFKATKAYCQKHGVPFPRILVAPQKLLVQANPQFNPEFFLYDFLFVYGAAFKPELAHERLVLALDEDMVEEEKRALRMTLTGPSREEMRGWRDARGERTLEDATVNKLADVSESMAIKKNGQARTVEEMVELCTFDREGRLSLFDGALVLRRDGPTAFLARSGDNETRVDSFFSEQVVPFATLPPPDHLPRPVTFGIKPLGTRSGFDLSGPTTGFLIWINGQAFVYDGPVGTRYLLEHQGISGDDVAGVILSHCHEDHMGAFVELILAGIRPKVYTAEPVYRSALVKLASFFRRSSAEVATFIDYQRVTPGEPVDVLGAKLDLFYTVHAIPTVGARVTMSDRSGGEHRILISGDTMHLEGLEKMHTDGVVHEADYARMRNLVPQKKEEGTLFFCDVGESIIHGHPKDWQGNPNRVLYYHCPDNEHTRSFGHELAVAGSTHTLIETAPLHPVLPKRLQGALCSLGLNDSEWLSRLLREGRTREVGAGVVIARPGKPGNTFSLIVSGSASVLCGEAPPLLLRPGEFFGAIELVDRKRRYTATVRSETPMELFELEGKLFHEYVRATGGTELLERIVLQRPAVEGASLFRHLDLGIKNLIAAQATAEQYASGAVILEGPSSSDFFLLVDGRVELETNGNKVALKAEENESFFGESSAVDGNGTRTRVLARSDVRVLRIPGAAMRDLCSRQSGVRYALETALRHRAG